MKRLNLIIMTVMALVLFGSFAAAQENEGYDENTELKLSGAVIDISDNIRGPVVIMMQARNHIYAIYTSPQWFWESLEPDIRVNTRIQVIGSKTIGRDGRLRVVCRQLKNLDTGKIYTFRDKTLTPMWRGDGRRGRQSR